MLVDDEILLAQHVATRMLEKRYGREAMLVHARHNEKVREASAVYDVRANAGDTQPIYLFDHGVLRGEDLVIDEHGLKVPGYAKAVDLDIASPYPDMI